MLCVAFGETPQASPLLAQLISNFYSQSSATSATTNRRPTEKGDSKSLRQDSIVALYLLDLLLSNFSSQWSLISTLKDSPLNDVADKELLRYFKTLSLHIRRLEFVKVHELLQPSYLPCACQCSLPPECPSTITDNRSQTPSDPLFTSVYRLALSRSISSLREKLREHSWVILRRSYRDSSLLPSSALKEIGDPKGQVSRSTEEWLSRRLFLDRGDGEVQEWLVARPNNEVICENAGIGISKWKLVHAVK